MKNILIIAYYYPPKGGSGVQRISKFAKYLCKLGHNVSVLTVKEESDGLLDESMYDDIKYGVKVYRTEIIETNTLKKVMSIFNKKDYSSSNVVSESAAGEKNAFGRLIDATKAFIRKIGKKVFMECYYLSNIPDDKKGWIDFAVHKGSEIIDKDNIDLIISTSAPYTTHFIARKLAVKRGIRWIADFRDPWVTNAFAHYSGLLRYFYAKEEKRIVEAADKVISVSSPIIDDFINRYPKEPKEKFAVITNGYDEEDFENIDITASDCNDKFTILYNGTLYGIETPETFLTALQNLFEKNLIDIDKITVRFVGRIGYSQKITLDKFKAKYPMVMEYKEFVPHKQCLMELAKTNASLLIINEGKGTECVYTGKVFEYIRANKPIIGIVPNGVARDLIKETNTGYLAYPQKIDEIELAILNAYDYFVNNKPNFNPNFDKIQQYSRESLTKKLIGLF